MEDLWIERVVPACCERDAVSGTFVVHIHPGCSAIGRLLKRHRCASHSRGELHPNKRLSRRHCDRIAGGSGSWNGCSVN